MSIVSAYVELPLGDNIHQGDHDNIQEGYFYGKTSEGLDVYFLGAEEGEGPPDSAQVYLVWEPRVYALWNDEGEENGEDREDADGSNPVERDEAVPTEPDLGTGEGGEGNGDVPAAETGGGAEAAE